MTAYILRRLMQTAVLVAVMSVIVFFGIHVVGDPDLAAGQSADGPEGHRGGGRALGLDRPIWEQYLHFVSGALRGDLGRSFIFGEPALTVILQRMPATLELAFTALVMAIAAGIPLGLYAGLKPDSSVSKTIMAGSILGFSLPTFWVGLMLIMVFAVMLGWLPSTGRGATATYLGITSSLFTLDGLRHILLPAFNLALLKFSLVIRLTRAGAREALQQDYIKFARAKGLSPRRIVGVHLLKNILIPVVTVRRPRVRQPRGLLRRHRDHLRLARHGQAPDQRHPESRPARDRRPPHHHRAAVRADQLRGRRPLHRARPARAHRSQGRMSVVGTHGEAEIERPPTGTAAAVETPLRRLIADYFESRLATAAFVLLVTIIALALLAPLIVPQNPYNLAEVDVLDSRLPPGTKGMAGYTYWLGTDGAGRDLVSAMLYGLRISLAVGVVSCLIATVIGAAVGLIAAYVGRPHREPADAARRPAALASRPSSSP